MKDFLARFPFALLGAFGLISLASGVIDLERHIADWVTIWQSVTYPIWEFVFGWLFEWIDWKFPGWLKDYLTIGFINGGVYFRTIVYIRTKAEYPDGEFRPASSRMVLRQLFVFILFWPYSILEMHRALFEVGTWWWKVYAVYLESFIYALFIIAASYALIFSSVSSPAKPQQSSPWSEPLEI